MRKTINFIFLTLLMTTLMFAPLMEATSSGQDHREVFSLFDQNGDGYITKEDVENFLQSQYSNSISNKVDFKRRILEEINKCENNKMSFNDYVRYMNKQAEANPSVNYQSVQEMFPGKSSVTRDELCTKIPSLDRNDLKDSYTIEEIVDLVYN